MPVGLLFPNARPLLTSGFSIASSRHDEMVVVAVSGEVDLSTAPALATELRRALGMGLDVLVDLARVAFMDSSGLSVLLSFSHEAKSGATGFWVTPGSPQVQRLFELSGVDRVLSVAPGPLSVRPAA